MEADWEVELGGDAHVIDAQWPGLVDLRLTPERARYLTETAELPALANALASLNTPPSPVWTSKCDVWQPDTIDPYEVDLPGDENNAAIACYIDLLPGTERLWPTPESAVEWCKQVCDRLGEHPLRACRSDLIVRRAFLSAESASRSDFGVTVYTVGCGSGQVEAAATLSSALGILVDSIFEIGHPTVGASKLQ